MISDKQVKHEFLKMEADSALFSFTIAEVSVYFILRYQLEEIYRINSPQRRSRIGKSLSIAKRSIRNLINLFFNKPRTIASVIKEEVSVSSPLLFVSTSDWTSSEGESIELVDLIKYYKKIKVPIHFVQPDFNHNTIQKQSYHDGFSSMRTAVEKPYDGTVIAEVKKLLSFVSGKLGMNFNEFLESCVVTVAYTLSMARQLSAIIRSSDARMVFARSIYTEPWVPIACRNANALCVEVQHGVVSPDNIYYQTTNVAQHEPSLFLPDYILTLGRKWTEIMINYHQKYDPSNTYTLGVRNMPVRKKDPRRFLVLICLQPGLFDISPLVMKLCREYKAVLSQECIRLVIRPHPSSIQASLDYFSEFNNESCLEIENSRLVELSGSLEKSDLLVSLSSMCLYEALSIGLPVISFESSKGITITEGIMFASDYHEVFNMILQLKSENAPGKVLEYLSPFDESTLDRLLEISANSNNSSVSKKLSGFPLTRL